MMPYVNGQKYDYTEEGKKAAKKAAKKSTKKATKKAATVKSPNRRSPRMGG